MISSLEFSHPEEDNENLSQKIRRGNK
jgi:hypothetical protein